MNWKNCLTKTLGTDYPFIQAPMLGVTTPEMVAAISNAGALGSLPVGGLPPDKTLALIQQTKSLTGKPFAVNLFANTLPAAIDEKTWNGMQDLLEEFSKQYALPFQKQTTEGLQFFSYEDQVEILIKEKIPVVSFTFGIISDEAIDALHKNGAQLIGTATSAEEARILDERGIDMITAQGIEAGGHRGTFFNNDLPQIGLMALLPQLVDAINIPIIAAGAIADGRAVKAAMILGAQGVQAGTAFIASKESVSNKTYKEIIQHATDTSTVLTRAYTGRWMRCIKNKFVETIEASGLSMNEYPVQGSLTRFLRTLHENENAPQFLPVLAGQHVRKSTARGAAEIFLEMIKEAESIT